MASVQEKQQQPLLQHQPDTLKHALILEFGKSLLSVAEYEIEAIFEDLPPTLISDMYNTIIQEFDKCLKDLQEEVKVFDKNQLFVQLYLSPVFPKNLIQYIKKHITDSRPAEKTARAVNCQWIRYEDTVHFHFVLYEIRYSLQVYKKHFEKRGKWQVPLVYPNRDKAVVVGEFNTYMAEQIKKRLQTLLAGENVHFLGPIMMIGFMSLKK